MQISVFPAALRIDSKANALRFYDCVKHTILIEMESGWRLRIEPGNLISPISLHDIRTGVATFVPNLRDDDGSIAYRYRKYINAFLRY